MSERSSGSSYQQGGKFQWPSAKFQPIHNIKNSKYSKPSLFELPGMALESLFESIACQWLASHFVVGLVRAKDIVLSLFSSPSIFFTQQLVRS
jgi:hypothetical protein